MKKLLISALLAIIIGLVLGLYFFKKININATTLVNNINNQTYAIQVGVYKNQDNAIKESNKYDGIVINDNNLYRVYIGIVNNNIMNVLENYYSDINYYLKPIKVSSLFEDKLNEYEIVFNSKKSDYKIIMKNLLKEYENELYK